MARLEALIVHYYEREFQGALVETSDAKAGPALQPEGATHPVRRGSVWGVSAAQGGDSGQGMVRLEALIVHYYEREFQGALVETSDAKAGPALQPEGATHPVRRKFRI
jgi:hypothetical protein